MERKLIWLDGKFVPSAKAQIHILSHALHYGTGVFEGIRAYETPEGPAVFRLKEHVDRLFNSASAIGIKVPYSKAVIAKAIKEVIKRNKLSECYIRPIVFYGEGKMGIYPVGAKLRVAIAAWPWGAYLGTDKALSVGISRYIRPHPKSVVPGAKVSGNYATSAIASLEAHAHNFNENLLLDHEGFVAEGPGENIFIVKGRTLLTPKSHSILFGITRDSVMTIARNLKIPVREKKITVRELMAADEVFLTGTAVEVASVGRINNKKIGRSGGAGPITIKLRDAYFAAIRGKIPRYRKWLALV